ncbi:MAG: hypothetical protein ACYCX4_14660 [Bacillota bacterium]
MENKVNLERGKSERERTFSDKLATVGIRVVKGARKPREDQGGEAIEERSVLVLYVSTGDSEPTQKFEADLARTFRTSL